MAAPAVIPITMAMCIPAILPNASLNMHINQWPPKIMPSHIPHEQQRCLNHTTGLYKLPPSPGRNKMQETTQAGAISPFDQLSKAPIPAFGTRQQLIAFSFPA